MQEEISRRSWRALRLNGGAIGSSERNAHREYEAYHISQGRYSWKATAATIEKSVDIRAATRLTHRCLAYATCYVRPLAIGCAVAMDVMPQAKDAARKALELDDTLAEAHTSLGYLRRIYDWDWAGAERACKRAVELGPNSGRAHQGYAHYLKSVGRFDESVAEIKRALELEPVSVLINRDAAQVFYFARRYDQVIEQCHKTLELDPNMSSVYGWLGRAYEHKGLYDQAVETYLKQGQFFELGSEASSALKDAYATSGWKGFWLKWLDLEKVTKRRYGTPYWFAEIYARWDEKDQAFVWLEKAVRSGTGWHSSKLTPRWTAFAQTRVSLTCSGAMNLEP